MCSPKFLQACGWISRCKDLGGDLRGKRRSETFFSCAQGFGDLADLPIVMATGGRSQLSISQGSPQQYRTDPRTHARTCMRTLFWSG